MHIIFNLLFLSAAIKWGDWRRWSNYYPTLLFFIVGDLLKNFLLYNYPMWTYQEVFFAENVLRNHTIINLMIIAIVYPSTILLYLGRFPRIRWKQLLWLIFWVALYSGVEYINLCHLKLIQHHNGWNMTWSVIFNIVMFSMLRIHHKNPPLAWVLSIIWISFLLKLFQVPVDKMI
ncbi:MAG TPA: CBO0543 family protein [Chondromyces sp.]|nr:CBO0543 family protein [Chondromyces sp.]